MSTPTPELHPYFEPAILAEVQHLRDMYSVEQFLDETVPATAEPDPYVQALDRLARMCQEQRGEVRGMATTLTRVLDIIGMPMETADTNARRTESLSETRDLYRETCTVQEACQVVGVCRRTLYNWMAKGKVRVVRTAGGGPRIYRDSLFYEGDRR